MAQQGFRHASHPEETRYLKAADERNLLAAYRGKRCIITHQTVSIEWAHVVPFKADLRAATFYTLRALKLYPQDEIANSMSALNLIPLQLSLHGEFDKSWWTVFPSKKTLSDYIFAEEIFAIIRRDKNCGRPEYYHLAETHKFAVFFGSTMEGYPIFRRDKMLDIKDCLEVELILSVPAVVQACLPKLLAYMDPDARVDQLVRWSLYLRQLWHWKPGDDTAKLERPWDLPINDWTSVTVQHPYEPNPRCWWVYRT